MCDNHRIKERSLNWIYLALGKPVYFVLIFFSLSMQVTLAGVWGVVREPALSCCAHRPLCRLPQRNALGGGPPALIQGLRELHDVGEFSASTLSLERE